MEKKIDELKQEPNDPNSPESVKIKEEFWKKMAEHLEHTKSMVARWIKEDKQNEIK
jgi:hypothetical protein